VKNAFIIGEKIYLRPVEREDAPRLEAYFNDPEVTRNLAVYRPMNLAAEEEFVAALNRSEHELVLGIAVKQSDALVGTVGLHRIEAKDRHAGFGIAIGAKTEWGKGYGSEATRLVLEHAFSTLNLNRIWLHVYAENQRAIRVYEGIGFVREGVLRQHGYREGRYADTVVMGILRDDWLKAPGGRASRPPTSA
jgi:RimJ/RimL family protein N-acetyltransferase